MLFPTIIYHKIEIGKQFSKACFGLLIGLLINQLMRKVIGFRFSTVIALISGAPKFDNQLASIANTLKRVSKDDIEFVGVPGAGQQSLFSKVYASSASLDPYEFEVTRAYNSYHEDLQDGPLPYRLYTHLKNYQLTRQLDKSNFFPQLFQRKVSSVVTVGNFSLNLRIGEKLNQYCKLNNKNKPYTAFFHRQITERTVKNEEFFDFQYYNVEKAGNNSTGFVFPSLCVGYEGLYKAFQHLQTFKKDQQSDSFVSQNFSYDVSDLVSKSRAQFRSTHGISQDKHIIFIDGGEDVSKVKFSFKSFKNGLEVFFNKDQIKNISPQHFELFVRVPSNETLAAEIKGKIGLLPQKYKITLIEDKDRYAAMAASDFGLLHNGQATVEAAALQLPSLVVDNMSNLHAYFNNLYNGHASPLNIATNYEAYEDLCGSLTAIGEKIGSNILKHFQTPKLRYYYAKLYREQIQLILSKSNTNPLLQVSQTGLETGCRHLLARAAAYSAIADQPVLRKWGQRKQALSL